MAVDFNDSRLLLWMRANGIPLGDVLTIGRAGVFLLPEMVEEDARRFGIEPVSGTWRECAGEKYCEPLLMAMGAKSVRALDYSAYEGAELLHDLNQPLPTGLEGCCDLLFDIGSLEHVFNVPEALKSYVKLVRPGGWLALHLPTNGRCGHGFYQFSPELFYQFFSDRVGCRVEVMFCVRDQPLSQWYLMPSSAELKRRVEPIDSEPLHLLVLIKRYAAMSEDVVFVAPAQADYEKAWSSPEKQVAKPTPDPDPGKFTPKKFVGALGRKLMPITYWRNSVIRNDRRRRRPFALDSGELLPRIDPFSWRLEKRPMKQ